MTAAAGPVAGRVVHRVPGRVRIKFDKAEIAPEALARLRQAVSEVDGVARCDASPRTTSLVVHYDNAGLDMAQLAGAVGGLVPEEEAEGGRPDLAHERHPHSRFARGLNARFVALDRRIRQLTGHRVDLKLVLPVGFGVLAARQIITSSGGLPTIPWYVLLWYAFDSYLRLHHTPQGQAAQTLLEAATEADPAGD